MNGGWSAVAAVAAVSGIAAGVSAAAAAPPAAQPAPMTGSQVIQVLDQTIDWYRTLGIQQQAANEPSDLLILYDNRQTASQIVASSFDMARADVGILAAQPGTKDNAGASVASRTLAQLQDKFAAQGKTAHASWNWIYASSTAPGRQKNRSCGQRFQNCRVSSI